MRRAHPATRTAADARDLLGELAHALIAPCGGRGIVDQELEARGLSHRIAVQVPHWLVAPHLVANSDLVLTLVESLATTYAALLPLEVVALPLAVAPVACWQRWHERDHRDAAHVWLRTLVADVASA